MLTLCIIVGALLFALVCILLAIVGVLLPFVAIGMIVGGIITSTLPVTIAGLVLLIISGLTIRIRRN